MGWRTPGRATGSPLSTLFGMETEKSTVPENIVVNSTTGVETTPAVTPVSSSRARRGVFVAGVVSVLSFALLAVVFGSRAGETEVVTSAAAPAAEVDGLQELAGAASAERAAAAPGTTKATTKTSTKAVIAPTTSKVTSKPAANKPATTKPAGTKNQVGPAPTVVVSATTPAPTTTAFKGNGISGAQIPNGATVGKDIPAGRYWATDCWSWSVSGPNGTVASSSYRFSQSVIDVRNGEFFLTSTKCTWFPGTPPAAATLPTGKVIVSEQLTPGRWRAVNLDGCVTGPTSTRERAAITDQTNMIVWWSNTKDLVVTGNEGWTAYLVGLECGGLVKVG